MPSYAIYIICILSFSERNLSLNIFWRFHTTDAHSISQVIQELGGDAVDEALLTFQSMDHGETPRTLRQGEKRHATAVGRAT